MEVELFTFVECNGDGPVVSTVYLSRVDADYHFEELVKSGPMFVAYYCASVGGLVNAYCDLEATGQGTKRV